MFEARWNLPSAKERLASAASNSEKTHGQDLITDGGMTSTEDDLCGVEASMRRTSEAVTGVKSVISGATCGGSEKESDVG